MSDRAERIQRMREGRREGGETDDVETADPETVEDAKARDEVGADVETVDAETADETASAATAAGTADATPATADAGTATADAAETPDPAAGTAGPDATDAVADEDELDAEVAAALDGMDVPDDVDVTVPEVEAEEDADVAADEEAAAADDDSISVLEFVLGDERYCLDITFIEQIVERGSVTRIPNAPPFVEGVIDLRGDVTTVIDPKQTLATEEDGDGDLIVVFDSSGMDEEWNVGWAVDGVRRVSSVSLAAVKESPVDEPWINGVVKRDDDDGEFVIWTEPGELMQADGGESPSPNA